MTQRLDDGEVGFDEVNSTLEEDEQGIVGKTKKNAREIYDFTKEAVGKSGAVGVPVGAGAAALTNQPVELGAGAGLSASMVYDIAKYQLEHDYDFGADDAAFGGALTSLPAMGGYAASKREEIADYAGEAANQVAEVGSQAYQSIADVGGDAADYAMREGPQLANDVAASSDEAALGMGAGIASMIGGTYVLGKAYDKFGSDQEFETEPKTEYREEEWE